VWVVAGSSLHREFDELAGAGLTPLKVLQSTTRDAATFLGDDGRGEVAVGKVADLVLLDGDPTVDVAHLHRVSGVVRAGRHLSSDALAALKAA
jgi:imidazolonepropionase-like amidohydrolase